MKYRGVLLLICCLALCVGSLGQINTGKITGSVTDSSGAVVPAVPITALNDATGVVTRAETSEGGEYVLNFLVPGTYRIAVEKTGFKKILQTGVIVNAGGIERVDFTLAIGNVDQVIGVEANPITVATETSELSQTFSHKELDVLPKYGERQPR